jgi:hypothetical protein
VEAALLEVPGVKEATVATHESEGNEPHLVAYTVPSELPGPTVSAIRRGLVERLPGYMVPSAFVTLSTLPLDANAKVNRRALPAPGTERPRLDMARVRPHTLLQQQLADVWERVLAVHPVGIRDDFFDLGGSSLRAAEMADEVERLLGLRISLAAMLDYAPAAYPGPVTILWPAGDMERFTAARWWSKVAAQVDFRVVPGTHITSLTRHVDVLAREIRRALDEDRP